MPRLTTLMLGLMTATVAVTACGGGDEQQASSGTSAPSATSAAPTADAEFVAQAEEVCADYIARLPELPTSIDQAPAWFDETEANITAAVDRFRGLDYPDDATGEGVRSVLVAELGGSLTDIRSIRTEFDEAVRNRDQAAAAKVAERLDLFAASPPDTDGVLASAGLEKCDEAFGPGAA